MNSPGIVEQSILRVMALMNEHGQAIDSKGRLHVVMYHCTEPTIKNEGSKLGETRWGPRGGKDIIIIGGILKAIDLTFQIE